MVNTTEVGLSVPRIGPPSRGKATLAGTPAATGTTVQAAADAIVEATATYINRQITAHAKCLASPTDLDQEALRIGLMRLVGPAIKGRVWAKGRAARDAYLAAAGADPTRHAEAMRQLVMIMGVKRTAVYGAFGGSALAMRELRRRRREADARG